MSTGLQGESVIGWTPAETTPQTRHLALRLPASRLLSFQCKASDRLFICVEEVGVLPPLVFLHGAESRTTFLLHLLTQGIVEQFVSETSSIGHNFARSSSDKKVYTVKRSVKEAAPESDLLSRVRAKHAHDDAAPVTDPTTPPLDTKEKELSSAPITPPPAAPYRLDPQSVRPSVCDFECGEAVSLLSNIVAGYSPRNVCQGNG